MKGIDEKRFMPPEERKSIVQVAATLGMDQDVRSALARILALAASRKVGVAGKFMPDEAVSALLAERGIQEDLDEADFFKVRRVAIPYSGVSPRLRRDWEAASVPLEDFTAPQVRKAQVALGLLRIEGAQGLVIGRHDDPESQALAGGGCSKIIEDTTDTARLVFCPAFGAVCQSTLSPRRVSWLVQQLRFRYRDSRVRFLDTASPSMIQREEALEKILITCDRAVIVGKPGEASCEALVETALRRGKTAVIVNGPDDLSTEDFSGNARIALTAGAFALDETIRAVAEKLLAR